MNNELSLVQQKHIAEIWELEKLQASNILE